MNPNLPRRILRSCSKFSPVSQWDGSVKMSEWNTGSELQPTHGGLRVCERLGSVPQRGAVNQGCVFLHQCSDCSLRRGRHQTNVRAPTTTFTEVAVPEPTAVQTDNVSTLSFLCVIPTSLSCAVNNIRWDVKPCRDVIREVKECIFLWFTSTEYQILDFFITLLYFAVFQTCTL